MTRKRRRTTPIRPAARDYLDELAEHHFQVLLAALAVGLVADRLDAAVHNDLAIGQQQMPPAGNFREFPP